MAEIVGAFVSSHTPQLKLGLDLWDSHGERDRRNQLLLGKDSEYHSYEDLLAAADPGLEAELTSEVWADKYQRARKNLAELNRRLTEARPDVALIIGDDQAELFQEEGKPMFAQFIGDELFSEHEHEGDDGSATGTVTRVRHRVQSELNARVLDTLIDAEFDVMVFSEQPGGRSLGHAFVFPYEHMELDADLPMVPIFVNTYFPPNVPSPRRAYRLGQTIARAVESWEQDARVAVIASGGLSHFVVDEDLDRRFLEAIATNDQDALFSLDRKQLRSGTSELLNWIAAAGSATGLKPTVLEYIAGYRTPAGTGCGLGTAYWT